ncbi:MAG: hypothetical protein ACM336_10375 [Acidobacteriota bacterium]
MGPGNQDRSSPLVWRALAGIETGVLGGLAMFGCLAAGSLLDLQSIWIVPNLIGSTFAGRQSLTQGFGWTTATGLGLHVAVAGLIGMCFGLAVGNSRNRLRVVLLGVLAGLVWYYFSQLLFWKKLGAFVMIYSPPRRVLLGHLVYGLALGWFPAALRSLPVETPETAAASDAVE